MDASAVTTPITGPASCDVLIAGGGFPGLALAIALRQSLGKSFAVTVADPAFGRQSTDGRASAIAAAARRLFEQLGVWAAAADDAQPILDMVVTDSRLGDAVRPVFLTFGGEIAPGEPFAHMIENRHLIAPLLAEAKEVGVTLIAGAVTDSTPAGARVDVVLADGSQMSPRLVVAADGARSRCARPPAFKVSAGRTDSPASSSPSRTSAIIRGGPRSISSPPDRSRSCRSKAADRRWYGPRRARKRNASSRCLPICFTPSSSGASACISATSPLRRHPRAYPLGLSVARSFIAERLALIGDSHM